jgi:osmotically-inducible protein OsmY
MRRIIFVVTLLMVSTAGLLSGCERTDTTTTEPADTRAKMTDSDLENAIKAKLNSDAQLRAANLDLDADVNRNEVTVSGEVATQEMRAKAIELIRSAQAGISINDKIEVKPRELSRAEYTEEYARAEREQARGRGETVGDSLDDAWIHAKIVAKLIGDPDTPERKINVDVNNNVVTLRGTVNSAEAKAEAERVARETEGVKRVVNQLKVNKTT